MNQHGLCGVASSSDWHRDEGLGRRNGRMFIALLEAFRATGGTARAEVVDALLQDHQPSDTVCLAKLIDTGQLFGFEWRASLWIPMFQLGTDDLSLRDGAQRVRAKLPPLWSGWALASWFAAPNECLDGRSAADMIDLDLEAVLEAAQRLGSAGDTTPEIERPRREVVERV